MRSTVVVVVAIAAMLSGGVASEQRAGMNELAPTGRLRVALVYAPEKSIFFVTRDENGTPHGVTADLTAALAARLGLAVELTLLPNSGLATDALQAGTVDVSFMPIDDERAKRIAFGPAYAHAESTYMVTSALSARTVAEVDREGVRVIGIANTTTIRAAARSLRQTTIAPVTSVDEAVRALGERRADAFALTRDSLPAYVAQVPGSRMVDGAFQRIAIAIAVGQGKPAALAAVTAFMEDARRDGTIRRALDRAGFDAPVAPMVREPASVEQRPQPM